MRLAVRLGSLPRLGLLPRQGLFLLLLIVPGPCCTASWAEAKALAEVKTSQAAYVAEFARLQALVASCQTTPSACDGSLVGDDKRVEAGVQSESFTQHWDWLRATLDAAKDPKAEDRAAKLAQAQARLVAEQAEATGADGTATRQPEADPAAARTKVDAILRQAEFSRVPEQNYLEQKLALARLWLDRLFRGVAILVPHAAWAGLALEWGTLAFAGAGLIAWALRVSRQQRVAIAAPRSAEANWAKESENWAERARAAAGLGEWREAVHCLYWSAIVMLEGQKMWRANRARTPREYVRLLEPGSARRTALGGLTGVFERIWYGARPAAEQDYRQAEALLGQLRGQTNAGSN